MGPVKRILYVAPGLVVCVGAYLLDASIPLVIAAAIVFLLSASLPAVPRTIGLAVAPIIVAAGSTASTFLDPNTIAWPFLALAGLAPLFFFLGGAIPWRGLPIYAIALILVVLATLYVPGAPSLYSSDIATRAQVLILGAFTLILTSLAPKLRFSGRAEKETPPEPATPS